MRKGAAILTRWMTGAEDRQYPEVASEALGGVVDLTSQVVKLSENRPHPNIGLVYARETQQEHEGTIDFIKALMKYAVLCQRTEDYTEEGIVYGPWERVLTNAEIKDRLIAAGLGNWMADKIISGNPTLANIIGRLKEILSEL